MSNDITTPEKLKETCISLYGEKQWKARLAYEMQVNISTARRWANGSIPIPKTVSELLDASIKSRSKLILKDSRFSIKTTTIEAIPQSCYDSDWNSASEQKKLAHIEWCKGKVRFITIILCNVNVEPGINKSDGKFEGKVSKSGTVYQTAIVSNPFDPADVMRATQYIMMHFTEIGTYLGIFSSDSNCSEPQ